MDVMVAVGSNFFYTVTLPCTLWFFDRGKRETAPRRPGAVHRRPPHLPPDRPRPPRLHARADRVPGQHRPALPGRGAREPARQRRRCWPRQFPERRNTPTCRACARWRRSTEIEAQGWSLNPGRYVGVAARAEDDFDFTERLEELNEELETLNAEARELEERIAENVNSLLGVMRMRAGWIPCKLGEMITLKRGSSGLGRIDPLPLVKSDPPADLDC